MEYAHQTNNAVIGKSYLVANAIIKYADEETEMYSIPVFPFKHADEAFAGPIKHYHIDARFIKSTDWGYDNFNISKGETGMVVWCPTPEEYNILYKSGFVFVMLEYKIMKCIRKKTSLQTPQNPFHKYWEWYDKMLGKSCAGKKCPHYGTQMITVEGRLLCPMHKLFGDPVSETIVKPY